MNQGVREPIPIARAPETAENAALVDLLRGVLERAERGELSMALVVTVARGSPQPVAYGVAGCGDAADIVFLLERAKLQLLMPDEHDEVWQPGAPG